MKYHINEETGRPNICRAEKGKCPFADSPHYETKEAARKGYEETMKSEIIPTVKKEQSLFLDEKNAIPLEEETEPNIDANIAEHSYRKAYLNAMSQQLMMKIQMFSEIPWEQEKVEKCKKQLEDNKKKIAEHQKIIDEHGEEFARRGGWARAFLVSGGHVHKSMNCSSCRPTTNFYWLTEHSAKTEKEIVDAAGERACTICYPSAPAEVLNRKSKLVTKDEEYEMLQKEIKKSRQENKSVLNSTLRDHDGNMLYHGFAGHQFRVKRAIDALQLAEEYQRAITKHDRGLEVLSDDELEYYTSKRDEFIAAVAHKMKVRRRFIRSEVEVMGYVSDFFQEL